MVTQSKQQRSKKSDLYQSNTDRALVISFSLMLVVLIKAIGLVTAPHREQPKPPEFAYSLAMPGQILAGQSSLIGRCYDQPIRPKDHLDRIVPLLPTKNAQTNGNGNQSCYLAGISEELGNLMLSLTQELNHSFTDTLQIDQAEQEEDTVADSIRTSELDETEKEQLIMARRGQPSAS